MVLDFGSQVQVDSAPLSEICSVWGKQWISHCSGWILAHVLFFRSWWWDHSLFWQYGTKSDHLQGNPSRGLGPFGFHMYRVTQSVGQVRALPSGVPSQGLLQEIQNWKPIIKVKGETPRGRNLGALNYPWGRCPKCWDEMRVFSGRNWARPADQKPQQQNT